MSELYYELEGIIGVSSVSLLLKLTTCFYKTICFIFTLAGEFLIRTVTGIGSNNEHHSCTSNDKFNGLC